MLTYMEVHLYYTLPPTIFMYLLIRPLITSFDKIKIFTLCLLAVLYTTPCDNYIIYHKAWWYGKDAIIGTIGYVPIEEYFFFIVQTIFTSLWTILCSRWKLNSLFLKSSKSLKLQLTKYVGVVLMLVAILWCWLNAIPATKTFYFCSITWWSLLIIVLLWYITVSYIAQRYQQIMVSVVFPWIYLCYVNLIALRAGVWHINEATSFEVFVIPDLPLEEFYFFFISNFMVVIGLAGFDKSKAIIDTYYKDDLEVNLSTTNSKTKYFNYIKMLAKAAIRQEHTLDGMVIDDIATCVDVLNDGSKTFCLAANCFPNDQLFANRHNVSEYSWQVINNREPLIDWQYFEKQLSQQQLCTFRGIVRISYYMPQEPFYELVNGYKWDIDGRAILHENDLIEYSTYVASSVATLCTFIFCHKCHQWPDNMGPKSRLMLANARKMGLVLQICNISRDIIIDSETLGRCYIANDYLKSDELKHLMDKNPLKISNSQLKKIL